MGGTFIVPDVTVCASLQITNINIRDTEPWETDWISITGVQRYALGRQPVCLRSHVDTLPCMF